MSWISSNTTTKQVSQDVLSFYHGFSKTPVEPEIKNGTVTGYAATTLANATTKAGHTVLGTEVWANELPWFGFAPNKTVASSRVSGITNKNDLIRINEDGKDYIYIGEGGETFDKDTWDTVWQEITLKNGDELYNSKGEKVLRYYERQKMQAIEGNNNAGIDSAGYATRLFVDESTHTAITEIGKGTVIAQFAASTDSIKNGLTSSILNPVVYIDTTQKVAGTHYYDYNVSGTILWDSNVKSKNVYITCFRYIGKSTTAQVSEIGSTVKTHTSDISAIKAQLGMGGGGQDGTPSVTERVDANEAALKVLLGLAEGDEVAATESIATTAANAVSTSLTGTTAGTIGKAIADAKQEALDAINAIQHFSVVVVPEGQTMENVTPVENTIYLVKDANAAEGTYIEYIAFKQGETIVTEKIGSTAIDLSGYTTDAEHTALAERVTALDAATAGRVAVVEGKVSSLEDQVSTLTNETIPAIQQSVTDGVSEAKTYAEGQASAAQTAATTAASQALATARGEITQEIEAAQAAAESTAADELAAAVEQIGKDIEAAKNAAIASAEVTINAGTGIVVTPEGKGTTFEISVSDAVATASDLTALTARVTTLENTTVPGIDTRLQAAEATITSLTEEGGVIDGIEGEIEALAGEAGRVTVVEGKVSDIETSLAEGGATANAIKAAQDTADAKVASVTVASAPNGVSFSTGTTPALTVTTAIWEREPSEEYGYGFLGTGGRLITGDTALSVAQNVAENVADDVKSQSLAQTGELSGMFSVTTAGTVGTGITGITITDSGLTQAISDAKSGAEQTAAAALSAARGEITSEIGTAISGVEGKSLASTSTGSDLVTVTTAGTVGTGMTTTVDTTALATAISTAESNAISAAEAAAKAMTLSATDTDDAGKVTVTLGGTVETPTITVTTSDIASASTLSDLVNTVNTHIAEAAGLYLSVEKVDTLPADDKAEKNKIYLVPVDTEAGREQNIHTEYIWTNNKWEIIGTTAIDINSLEAAAEAAQTAADKAQEEVDALETVVATLTQTHTDDKAALESSITGINDTIAAMDSAETVNGLTVTQVDGKITSLTETLIAASVPVGTTSVEGNIAYVGSEKHVIAPEKFQTATTMPATLTSWVADLSNLEEASSSFAGCAALDTFIGDLSSLTNGFNMFKGCTSLKTFIGDLSSLTDGRGMFGDGAIQTGSSGFCKLDIDSLECIANTIKDVNYREGDETSLPPLPGQSYELWLGLASETFPSERSSKAIDVIQSKGWTVFINGTPLASPPNE